MSAMTGKCGVERHPTDGIFTGPFKFLSFNYKRDEKDNQSQEALKSEYSHSLGYAIFFFSLYWST